MVPRWTHGHRQAYACRRGTAPQGEHVMAELKQEFEFYMENKDAFLEKYDGRFIVLKDREVIGVYDDRLKAIQETAKLHALGTFLVQYVTEADDQVRFHSRVAL